MYHLDNEHTNRFSDGRYDNQTYQPQRYYDEGHAWERQIVEFQDVSYGNLRDGALAREIDPAPSRERDPYSVEEIHPILVRERDLDCYRRNWFENDDNLQREREYFPGPEHRLQEPRFQEPRFQEPRFQEPRFQQPQFQEPQFQDPRFPEPRPNQGARMPYYTHPRRALPPTSTPRGGPSWQHSFHRNHPPRRRHHLDDIFLPNHDDDEHPEHEEGFNSRHSSYRPPIRVDVKTTKSEAVTRPSTAITSNEKVLGEKVNNQKSQEKMRVTDPVEKPKDEAVKKCDNPKSGVKGPVTTTVNVSDSNQIIANCDFRSNERRNTPLDPRVNARNNLELSNKSESTNSLEDSTKGVAKSNESNETFNLSKSVNSILIEKKHENETNKEKENSSNSKSTEKINTILDPRLKRKHNINIKNNNENTKLDTDEYAKSAMKSGDNIATSNLLKPKSVLPTNNKSEIQANHDNNFLLRGSTSIITTNKEPIKMNYTKTNNNNEMQGNGETKNDCQNKIQIKDAQTKAGFTLKSQNFKNMTDNISKGKEKTQCSKESFKDVTGQRTNSDSECKLNKIADKTDNATKSKTSSTNKNARVELFKNNIETEDRQKLEHKNYASDSSVKEATQQNRKSKNCDKKAYEKVQDKKDNKTYFDRSAQSSVKVDIAINAMENNIHPVRIERKDIVNDIDIVKELDDLVNMHDVPKLPTKNIFKNIQDSPRPEDAKEELIQQTKTSEAGNLTYDTTPTSLPSSPQAIKKDIVINLIRSPLPKSSLASCNRPSPESILETAKDQEVKISPKSSKNIEKTSKTKLDNTISGVTDVADTRSTVSLNSPGTVVKNVSFLRVSKVDSLQSISDNSHSRINTDSTDGSILEDIFILEDALNNLDKAPEIIEVISSPTKSDGNTCINKNKGTAKGSEIIKIGPTPKQNVPSSLKNDLGEVQIIEETHDTIEIVDNDDDLNSAPVSDNHIKLINHPVVVIKIESSDDSERNSGSSTNNNKPDQPSQDFANFDTRGSFLWTFHQRFDDPRVVDMDISHSPSPSDIDETIISDQQKETARVIKDMDALWNEISDNKSNKDANNADIMHSNKVNERENLTSNKTLSVDFETKQTDSRNVKNYEKGSALDLNKNKKAYNTSIPFANQDSNYSVQDTLSVESMPFSKQVKINADGKSLGLSQFTDKSILSSLSRDKIREKSNTDKASHKNVVRSASFSHKNNVSNSSTLLRKTKSLNNIVYVGKLDVFHLITDFAENKTNDLKNTGDDGFTQTKTNKFEANSQFKSVLKSSLKEKSLVENSKKSFSIDYKDELLSLLSASGYNDEISDKIECFNKDAVTAALRNDKSLVVVIPKTVSKKSVVADNDNAVKNSESSIPGKGNGDKKLKRKRIRRIESSDEESPEESIVKKDNYDQPKRKKQKGINKPTGKQKISLVEEKKSKGNTEVLQKSPIDKESKDKTTVKKATPVLFKTNRSLSEALITQSPTKYVTKAEYVKSFAKSKSLVPNISLSIESVSKTQKIIQRRATFTCEADNESILKIVDSGERCKQKFLDLFGSVSDDEEDLIRPYTKVSKKSVKEYKKVEEKEKTNEGLPKKDTSHMKRKIDYISRPTIEESDAADSSQTTSYTETGPTERDSPKATKILKVSTKHKISGGNSCKRVKIKHDPNVQSIRMSETETVQSKLKSQTKGGTCIEANTEKDKNRNIKNLSSRRESSSSGRSRDSSCQEYGKEKKYSSGAESKQDRRTSRSQSKESNSSILSDMEKNIVKSVACKEKKKKTFSKEGSLDKASSISDSSKSAHLSVHSKDICSSENHRPSTSSVEGHTSGHSYQRGETINKDIPKKVVNQRKSLSKDGKVCDKYRKKETNSALKQKHEVTKDGDALTTSLKQNSSVRINDEENVTEHSYKDCQKTELCSSSGTNTNNKVLTKKILDENKSPVVKSVNKKEKKSSKSGSLTKHKKHALSPSTDDSDTGICKRDKILLKDKTKDTVNPTNKIEESCRRNSGLDLLSSSSDASLIIDEIQDLPLMYRSSEGEINVTFQICQSFTPRLVKYDKITRIMTVDIECVDKAYINDPPEIHTTTKSIKQMHKEDDDVIEIRPVIPMIDLTEEVIKINREASAREPLGDLLLEAKKEIDDLTTDEATITLYRSEEDGGNQDEEVQAVAASISLRLPESRSSNIKNDKESLQLDATTVSLNKTSDEKEKDLVVNTKQKTPDGAKESVETASSAALQRFSNLDQNPDGDSTSSRSDTILENTCTTSSETPSEPAVTSQPPAIHEVSLSLEHENQRAVSSILNFQQTNNQRIIVSTDSLNTIQNNFSQNTGNLQSITNDLTQTKRTSNNTDVENSNPCNNQNYNETRVMEDGLVLRATQSVNSAEQNYREKQNCPTTSSVPDNNKRPRIIVRPTRAERNIEPLRNQPSLEMRLSAIQHKIVQEDSLGQHKGLPQALREYRPAPRVKAITTVVPPALVNINTSQISAQKNYRPTPTEQTSPQNVGTITTQNAGVKNNHTSSQISNAPDNHSFVDLTDDNGEVSAIDMRLIVDIFTRHIFFLAHLCQAQNGYIEYLRQQPFCQNYFRAEIALFEEQKHARLISQSMRLVAELRHLNIRATRNLSGSASELVERITINLANRMMPKQVTRSMIYLLIAQLVTPQSELFARIPLLKALIRICNVVLERMYSKSTGRLTEEQRKVLTHQVQEYNRLFGIPQLHTRIDDPNNNRSLLNASLITDVGQSQNQMATALQNNQSVVANPQPISIVEHLQSRDDLNSQMGRQTVDLPHQISINSQPSINIQQPSSSSNTSTPLLTMAQLLGSPRQSVTSGGFVRIAKSLSDVPNATQRLDTTAQTRISPPMYQPAIRTNFMNPPNCNIPIVQQEIFVSPRPPRALIVPNRIRQINGSSVQHTRDLPGGANTNTLGCTPRYIPNYGAGNQNHVYIAISKPQSNTSPVNRTLPPSGLNTQSTRSVSRNQSNLNYYPNNSILSNLLSDGDSSTEVNSTVHQSPRQAYVPQSPQHSSSESSLLQNSHNNAIFKSPLRNILSQSPRYSAEPQSPREASVSQTLPLGSSSSRLPGYEESVASKSTYTPVSNISLSNQLPSEDAKKRNENLLMELLSSAPNNDPLFTRSSSPANDNFRIKLPFTQPDTRSSTTVHTTSPNMASTPNTVSVTFQSNVSVSNTAAFKTSLEVSNTIVTSDSQTVPVTKSQSNVQSHEGTNVSPQYVASGPAIVLVNNAVPSTRFVVGQPERTTVLNQGLAALSSIGSTSAMLNSSFHQNQNSQSKNEGSMNTSESDESHITDKGKVTAKDTSFPTFKITVPKGRQVSSKVQSESKNKEKSESQTNRKLKSNTKRESESNTTPKSKKPKPKPKTKPSSKKPGRPTKRNTGNSSKTIDIVDLLSSDDDDKTSENQSREGQQTTEPEFNTTKNTKAQDNCEELSDKIGQDSVKNQNIAMEKHVTPLENASSSITEMQNQDPPENQLPISQPQIDYLHPSSSNSPNSGAHAGEHEGIETIDLTWIDDMDDQELQREMDFVFIKKEEPKDDYEQSEAQNKSVGEDDTTVYTVNVQRLCICSKTAQYNCVCGEAWYCGQECQLKDWESHQKNCQTIGTEEDDNIVGGEEHDMTDKT